MTILWWDLSRWNVYVPGSHSQSCRLAMWCHVEKGSDPNIVGYEWDPGSDLWSNRSTGQEVQYQPVSGVVYLGTLESLRGRLV